MEGVEREGRDDAFDGGQKNICTSWSFITQLTHPPAIAEVSMFVQSGLAAKSERRRKSRTSQGASCARAHTQSVKHLSLKLARDAQSHQFALSKICSRSVSHSNNQLSQTRKERNAWHRETSHGAPKMPFLTDDEVKKLRVHLAIFISSESFALY